MTQIPLEQADAVTARTILAAVRATMIDAMRRRFDAMPTRGALIDALHVARFDARLVDILASDVHAALQEPSDMLDDDTDDAPARADAAAIPRAEIKHRQVLVMPRGGTKSTRVVERAVTLPALRFGTTSQGGDDDQSR